MVQGWRVAEKWFVVVVVLGNLLVVLKDLWLVFEGFVVVLEELFCVF